MMLISPYSYSFGAWYCSTLKPEDRAKSLEWQQKFFDLNNVVKGADHEDTIRSKERLDYLLRTA
jgi:hypothetical protein